MKIAPVNITQKEQWIGMASDLWPFLSRQELIEVFDEWLPARGYVWLLLPIRSTWLDLLISLYAMIMLRARLLHPWDTLKAFMLNRNTTYGQSQFFLYDLQKIGAGKKDVLKWGQMLN